jgi:hypothetical protein
MKDKRFWLGVTASAIWLGVAAYVLCTTTTRPDKLNEWGDFIAGFSAPLAFFWLVLGYMQQGEELKNNTEMLRLQAEELKHSTDALRLQAEELKNSVEQQSRLVDVSREQVQLEIDAKTEERQRRREAARPKFAAARNGSAESSGVKTHGLKIVNIGNLATDVSFKLSPQANALDGNFPVFENGREFRATITYATDFDCEVRISFNDADGFPGEVIFPIAVSRQRIDIGAIERVT